ncbi:hypothetical protein J7643_16930 [bacterium]|nr:hypothetical protein [bacterium]
MQLNRMVSALSLALTVALLAAPVSAAPQTKTMAGPTKKTPEVRDGVKGNWHEYVEYTYENIADRLKEIYTKELGGTWTEGDFAALIPKIQGGQLTYDQVTSLVRESKDLLDHNPDWAKEWHSREIEPDKLRAAFGPSGGWIDGISGDATKAGVYQSWINSGIPAQNVEGNGGDGMSILGQASRLLRLSELMNMGILPGGRFSLQGVFTHYINPNMASFTSPYFAPLTDRDRNAAGGSWTDILSLVQAGSNADQTQRSIYEWYSEVWGQAYKIDMKNVTAAQLRDAALAIYKTAASTASPIALDLNDNGLIGVTGRSTAQVRRDFNAFVREGSVLFDLLADGRRIRTEWMNAENDALLVDDRKGEVTKAAKGDGVITGKVLFGNAGGFENGYIKLAMILMEHNRYASAGKEKPVFQTALRGSALEGLKAWVDRNHDAKVQSDELFTLSSLGITEVEVFPKKVKNAAGETLIQSSYTQNGKRKLAEDVWFAVDLNDTTGQ